MFVPRALTTRIGACYEWLVAFVTPDAISGDREARNRAQMFLVSHFFGPFLGSSVPLALYVLDPTPGVDILILWASILAFWLFPFLLRLGVPYPCLVVLSIANLNFAILWSCFHYGGVASPTLTWILIIPILSVFYIGHDQRLKPILLGISGGAFGIFLVASALLRQGENDLPATAQLALGATSTVATLCYVAAMAIYYAKVFNAGVDLEAEVRRRQQLAADLRTAVIAANRASAAKSEFLARMSHELRTPLNAIIGYAELLKEEVDGPGRQQLIADLDRILEAGRYLVRLINMILDLSKIEAGRMEFDVRPCSLKQTIGTLASERRAMIEASGTRLELDLDPDLDVVQVDEGRLREMVDSILENAAQHTRGGLIVLATHPCEIDGRAAYSVTISDTGAGIPSDILPTIFETFSTPRDAAGGQYGGTGLNLTVTRRLCRAMGGDITADSTPGVGSTFVVTLPVHPEPSSRSLDLPSRPAAA